MNNKKMVEWLINHPKFQKISEAAAMKIRYDYNVLGKQYTSEDVKNLVKMMYDTYGDIKIGVVKDDDK